MECRLMCAYIIDGAGISTLSSIFGGLGPSFFVERWNGRVLERKKWMERLFISRQSPHFFFHVQS